MFYLEDPLTVLGMQSIKFIKAAILNRSLPPPRPALDPYVLCSNFSRIRDMFVDTFKPFMKPAMMEKISDCCKYYGGRSFLSLVGNSEDYYVEQEIILSNIENIMRSHLEYLKDLSKPKNISCSEPTCNEPVAKALGNFAGSRLCVGHHRKKFEDLYEGDNLNVKTFLKLAR